MKLSGHDILRHLGAGNSIQSVCAAAGISREEFDTWWAAECARRAPQPLFRRAAPVSADVSIVRNAWGIPHIFALQDADLFFAYGYAMAQDRLWQMDYLRRKALGRLSEIFGAETIEQDTIARTVGLNRIAAHEVETLPHETRRLLEAFTRGVNVVITESSARLPVEFGLLDYAPEPWSAVDSVAIWAEFRYYLTVRFPVIVLPELARRALNNEGLMRAFLTPEAGDETIVPPGFYPARAGAMEKVGETVGDPQEGVGSNNWVVDGKHSTTGFPLLASDPHIAFGVTGCWYEAHLCGGSFNVTGAGYVGVPGILFGRNTRVAWGITNNICSQRDLYQERTDPQHPDCFLYDGQWEPARVLDETIRVRGSDDVPKTMRYSRNGPIVDEILPALARGSGPIALRWLGATACNEIGPMLAMNRAQTCDEFRAALHDWRVPTLSAVFADVDGRIGYQCIGRIPVRNQWERGYRHGWEPAHQWQSVVPYAGMPALADPPHGWIRSANNRTAPEDYPYPLYGTWNSGHRALRIRHMLEAQDKFSAADFARMHQDALSMRAVEGLPRLLAVLADVADERVQRTVAYLRAWDCRMETDSVGASLFDIFFNFWSQAVAQARFDVAVANLMAGALGGLSLELLAEDKHGWFANDGRVDAIRRAFAQALEDHTRRLGPDPAQWTWGRSHTIALQHTLSARGELGALLNRGGLPVRGNGVTVCNTGYDPNYMAALGANYRLIADLSTSPPALAAIDAAGASGHPGSAHYGDQLYEWISGRYHSLPLERAAAEAHAQAVLVLHP